MMNRLTLALLMMSPFAVYGAQLTTFTTVTTATASEVNGNFEALNTEIGANKTAIENISLTEGPAGPQGVAGPAGATGATGSVGATGPAGATGSAGAAGAMGATGSQGIQGVAGTPGAQGIQGIQGVEGPAGPAGASGGGSVGAATVAVNCATDSIQTVLDTEPGAILTINLTGPCAEELSIARSNVIIEGAGATLTVASSPGIHVFGASNVEINNLTINAGANTALALDGAQVSLDNTHITSVSHEFFSTVVDHSKLAMTGSSITHTTPLVSDGALLAINNSTVQLHGGNSLIATGLDSDAVIIISSSSLSSGFDNTSVDIISGGGLALLVEGASSAFSIGDFGFDITGTVEIFGGSYFLVDTLDLTGNLVVTLNSSMLGEGNMTINGDVELYKGGMLEAENATLTGGHITVSRGSELALYESTIASDMTVYGLVSLQGGFASGNIHCAQGDFSVFLTDGISGAVDGTGLTVTGNSPVSGQPSCVLLSPTGPILY